MRMVREREVAARGRQFYDVISILYGGPAFEYDQNGNLSLSISRREKK